MNTTHALPGGPLAGHHADADVPVCTYDPHANALYIELKDDPFAAWTEEVNGMTLVDCASDGKIIGIEVLHPQRTWPVEEILDRYTPADGPSRRSLAAALAYAITTVPPLTRSGVLSA
jgi:uncharacterized protein YuzE